MLWQDDVNEYYIISRHAGAINTISPIVSTSKRGGGSQRAQGGGPPLEGPGPVRRTGHTLPPGRTHQPNLGTCLRKRNKHIYACSCQSATLSVALASAVRQPAEVWPPLADSLAAVNERCCMSIEPSFCMCVSSAPRAWRSSSSPAVQWSAPRFSHGRRSPVYIHAPALVVTVAEHNLTESPLVPSLTSLVASTRVLQDLGLTCFGRNTTTPEDTNGAVNSSVLFQAFPEPPIVPWPSTIEIEASYLALLSGKTAIVAKSVAAWPAASLLAEEIALATDGELKLTPQNASALAAASLISSGSIELELTADAGVDAAAGATAAAYSLTVGGSGVVIASASYEGLVTATATLLQALERSADHDSIPPTSANCSNAAQWRIPHISVTDTPQFGIRGVMVDAAREFLPLSALKGYVILCRCGETAAFFSLCQSIIYRDSPQIA